MKATNLFKIQCPKLKSNKIIINSPSNVEIKVVSHGEVENQDSNHPRFCFLSLFLFFFFGEFLLNFSLLSHLSDFHYNKTAEKTNARSYSCPGSRQHNLGTTEAMTYIMFVAFATRTRQARAI